MSAGIRLDRRAAVRTVRLELWQPGVSYTVSCMLCEPRMCGLRKAQGHDAVSLGKSCGHREPRRTRGGWAGARYRCVQLGVKASVFVLP